MNKWISIIVEQNGIENYKDFGLGIDLSFHKHNISVSKSWDFPWHFHILITVAFWFIELQIGYDSKDLEAK